MSIGIIIFGVVLLGRVQTSLSPLDILYPSWVKVTDNICHHLWPNDEIPFFTLATLTNYYDFIIKPVSKNPFLVSLYI